MRGQEFRVRDKKVQKMTRDGLTEQNLSQGTKRRISSRVADVSFTQNKPEDKKEEIHNRQLHKKMHQQTANTDGSSGAQNYLSPEQEEIIPFADASVPEVWGPQNVPASMRDAGDKPIPEGNAFDTRSSPMKEGQEKRHRQKMVENKEMNEKKTFSADGGHGRLKFEAEPDKEPAGKDTMAMKKKQAVKFIADGTKTKFLEETDSGRKSVIVSDLGRLKFEAKPPKEPVEKRNMIMKKKQAVKFTVDSAKSEGKSHSELPEGNTAYAAPSGTEAAGTMEKPPPIRKEPAGKSKQQKKLEKAQQRVERAGGRLEKAQEKLPTRRHIQFAKQYDSETGKVKPRLYFETEIIPENEKPPFSKRAAKTAKRAVTTTAVLKVHQKIRETERDNVGVEAAHKAEFATERGMGRYLRKRARRLHEKPYREMNRAKKRLEKANINLEYQKMLKDNPQLQKNIVAKWIQKQKLKRSYAAAAREAEKGVQHTTNVLTAIGQKVRALAQAVATRKTALGIVAVGALLLPTFGSLFSSCSAMLTGIQSAIVSTCYVAEDTEINASELTYTELETNLQITINNTETDYPGYDEYQYFIGEIGHNPYELMGYLSAVYDNFTYTQVKAEILRLFDLQYQLTWEETVETRTYTDEEGVEHEYEWNILKTTLSVTPLSEIIAANLPAGDPYDRYGVYMQTCGNRQCYGNPFDFAWISHVTSPYGYRIHPISGEKNLHRGVDIGTAEGTPVLAVQDGRVVSAGDAGGYGLCVAIEGEDGYQSRYAHCSSLFVSAGQQVKRGDIIAAVGSTGNSTGAHLHLEITHNGDYLNPYFYVDNGGGGYLPGGGAAGSPDFSENPGDAMGNGSFQAMLMEAEKYLGYPYVWGGSSPSTSFDCSGYVSWVINHSGVGNVGRQTAQGLYNLCTPITRANMQPGDLVFFTGTYSTANPVTHVGIYIGGGRMIHCGSPISYASIDSSYWASHFYSGGRLP